MKKIIISIMTIVLLAYVFTTIGCPSYSDVMTPNRQILEKRSDATIKVQKCVGGLYVLQDEPWTACRSDQGNRISIESLIEWKFPGMEIIEKHPAYSTTVYLRRKR